MEYAERADYRARVKEVIRSANRFELLVILAADPVNKLSAEALPHFWAQCAAEFKSNPNVFFAPGAQALVDAIRSSGADQPVLIAAFDREGVHDPNIIYEATPRYATTRTDEDRWTQFGFLAGRAPVLVNDMDPQLDRNSAECAAFPADPGAATRLVQDNLAYFDAHHISWTLSQFRPGRMLTEYRFFNWSKLDDGWTCGEDPSRSGIAMVLLAHLWSGDPHGLFAVNHVTGGFVIARGAVSTAYGPILAEREMSAAGSPLPLVLGNVRVRVKDSRGIARFAPLLYTGAGWSNISFVVPADAALGPAEVAVVRSDGSSSAGRVIIADAAPGFFTASYDARGSVTGQVVQRSPASTTVRLAVSGIRYAGPKAVIRITVENVPVPVLSFGAADDVGRDQVTVKLPAELRGIGETDMVMTVNGLLSNVVRINCGTMR